jgi:DNA polymerase elongation subunit (family B)
VNYEWRIHYTDIEVDDRYGFPENGEQQIICITAYDNFQETYITWLHGDGNAEEAEYPAESSLHDADVDVRWYDSEADMLRSYFAYLRATRPAVITAWNIEFDAEYLIDRARRLKREEGIDVGLLSISPLRSVSNDDGFDVRVKGMEVFDLLQGFKATKFTELDSYRLDNVADQFVGETKEEYVGTIGNLWEDDPAKLIDYNLRDVELCVEIDQQQSIIPFWTEVKSIVSCQLSDATIESTAADRYILSEYHGDVVFPNQGSADETSESFSGGAVFEPISGVREKVATLDLKSLYPMSMLTLNASPETKVDPAEYDGEMAHSPNGIYFRQDEPGLTKQLITDLLDRRNEKKAQRDACDPGDDEYGVYDRQQRALKVIMNTLYGVLSWSQFRLYDQEVGAAVTSTGRECIAFTKRVAEAQGRNVIYGDTDSCLLQMDDVDPNDSVTIPDGLRETHTELDETEQRQIATIVEECHILEGIINDRYDEYAANQLGTDSHRFEIEFEKLYQRYFQAGKKKRYAGKGLWNEGKWVAKVSVTGFEYVRSDISAFSKEIQKGVIDKLVEGEGRNDVLSFIDEKLDEWERREVTIGEIGLPEGIGKPMNDYTSETHPVRAAKHGNLLLGTTFVQGSKPKRYYVESVHPALYRRLEEEVGLDPARDRSYAAFREEPDMIAVDRPEEFAPEITLDWDEMRRKNVKQPLKGILSSLDAEWDELLADTHQTGLHAFADD